MDIQKEKKVNIFQSKLQENKNYEFGNLIYCHQQNKHLSESTEYSNWIVYESKNPTQHDLLSFTIWYNDSHKSKLIIKDLNILNYHLFISKNDVSLVSCNRIAYFGMDKVKGISIDGKKIDILSNELYQFSHLVYFSLNDNCIIDVKDIILSFRFGVKVIYMGNAILGDLLENLYPTCFYNVSNISEESLKNQLNRLIELPNRKSIISKTETFGLNQQLNHIFKHYVDSPIWLSNTKLSFIISLNSFDEFTKGILKVEKPNYFIENKPNAIDFLSKQDFGNWALMIRDSSIPLWYLNLIFNYLNELKLFETNDGSSIYKQFIDILWINSNHCNSYLILSVLGLNDWQLQPIKRLNNGGLVLFRSDRIVKRYIMKDISLRIWSLTNLIR